MKIYNERHHRDMSPALLHSLKLLQAKQAFEAKMYIEAKAARLNEYLKSSRLKSCVVAVSGGIDSAVVLGIAAHAQSRADSPIERIVPVMLPVFDSEGATNQESATAKGASVAHAFGLEPVVMPLSQPHQVLKDLVDSQLKVEGEAWAAGQLVSYLRTPTLYYITSLLTQLNQPGVLLGTTNKDEGAYLGYFGKASDGLVDVQVISDIHKSQVFEVGAELGVPEAVLAAVPTGDMYDGRIDEEVFGASYGFVELFLRLKDLTDKSVLVGSDMLDDVTGHWSTEDHAQYELLAGRLETMHHYNHHKYLGKSPAVHLDLWYSQVSGGWDYYVHQSAQ